MMEKAESDHSFNKEDIVNSFKLSEMMKGTQYLKPHYLYNIPKKVGDGEMYEDGELTE